MRLLRPASAPFLLVLVLALVSSTVSQILPSAASADFPACGLSCPAVYQAALGCEPPAAPVTNQATYVSCFCQSSLLTLLHSSPDGTCNDYCTVESDRVLLETWYNNYCNSGGTVGGAAISSSSAAATTDSSVPVIEPAATTSSPVAAAPTTPTTLATSTIISLATTTGQPTTIQPTMAGVATIVVPASAGTTTQPDLAAATNTATGLGYQAVSSNQSWISTHWRWLLMIGVLIVAFALLTLLAVFLRRRHQRKVEERRAAASGFPTSREKGPNRMSAATPELWGPHQHMAHTGGWEYTYNEDKARQAEVEAAMSAGLVRKESRRPRRHRSERSRGKQSRETSLPGRSTHSVDAVPRRAKSERNKERTRVDGSQRRSRSLKERRTRDVDEIQRG